MRMEAPGVDRLPLCVAGVYLHAYGGTAQTCPDWASPAGLSPCVWRHLAIILTVIFIAGSISMRMEAPVCVETGLRIARVYLHAYGGTCALYLRY